MELGTAVENQDIVPCNVVNSIASSYLGSQIIFDILPYQPDLSTAPERTQARWQDIREKGWKHTQVCKTRIVRLDQFSLLAARLANLHNELSLPSPDVEQLERMYNDVVQETKTLRIACEKLPEDDQGINLDILKGSANEALAVLCGPMGKAMESQYAHISELRGMIQDVQAQLLSVYDDYFGTFLTEQFRAQAKVEEEKLKLQFLQHKIETAKEKRRLLASQLELAQQTNAAQRKVLQDNLDKQQAAIISAQAKRQADLTAAQANLNKYAADRMNQHAAKLTEFSNEMASIK